MQTITRVGPHDCLTILEMVSRHEFPLVGRPDWIEALSQLSADLDAMARTAQVGRRASSLDY